MANEEYPKWIQAIKWTSKALLTVVMFEKVVTPATQWASDAFVKWVRASTDGDLVRQFDAVGDLTKMVRDQFEGHNILVLGPRSAGKSTLLSYMRTGRPMPPGGDLPNRSLGAVIYGKRPNLDANRWSKLKEFKDGDYRSLWKLMIEEIRPDGIVYMLDGRKGQATTLTEVEHFASDVLSVYVDAQLNLPCPRAIHIFLNFADVWAKSDKVARELKRHVENALAELIENNSVFESVKADVTVTQLATTRSAWDEADNAINRLGADLT